MPAARTPNQHLQERVSHSWSRPFGDARVMLVREHTANADGGTEAHNIASLPARFIVDEVRYVNVTGLAADVNNHAVIAVKQGANVVATWNTETGEDGTIAADTYVTLTNGTLAKRIVEADEELTLSIAETGTTTVPVGQIEVTGRFIPSTVHYKVFRAEREFQLDSVQLKLLDGVAADTTDYYLFEAYQQSAQVLADDIMETVDFANNEIDIAAHPYLTGDGPMQLTTVTTLPSGLSLATDYWIIKVNAGSFSFATSLENALAGTAVALADAGTGAHTISDTATTTRVLLAADHDTRAAGEGALVADTFATMANGSSANRSLGTAGDTLFLRCAEAGDTALSDIELVLFGRYL